MKTLRSRAPMQRSTATDAVFSFTYTWIALAAPMPPSSSAVSPTTRRNHASTRVPRVSLRAWSWAVTEVTA